MFVYFSMFKKTLSNQSPGMWRREWQVCHLKGIEKEKKMGFEYNHKIMIIKFRSRHLVLWLLGDLWSARVCVR